jgi:CRP-like cAMP-binding protein
MKGLHAFRGLGDGEILHIMESAAQKLYRKGERIFEEGETQAQMFVVIRGEVHITVQAAGDRILDRLQTGSIFGELAFLNGKPRSATATAATDSLLLIIDRQAFDQLVQHEQHLGLTVFNNIALDLSEKLRASTSHLFQK